jgi:hypothetical protein
MELIHVELLHGLILGRPGSGKSTLIATMPKRLLVIMTDPPGKEQPYLDRGIAGAIEAGPNCYFRNVYSKKDPKEWIIRIEFWGEPNPAEPSMYAHWIARSVRLEQDIREWGIKSIALDTATYFELCARYYSLGRLNRDVKDGRQHYAFSTNACEQYIMMRFPNFLLCNSFVLCHIDDQKDESEGAEGGVVTRKMAALPGKMPNRVSGGFGEVWRVYVDEGGNRVLQTQQRPNNTYDCKSLLGVPDFTYPHYEAVKKALEARAAAKEKADGEVVSKGDNA